MTASKYRTRSDWRGYQFGVGALAAPPGRCPRRRRRSLWPSSSSAACSPPPGLLPRGPAAPLPDRAGRAGPSPRPLRRPGPTAVDRLRRTTAVMLRCAIRCVQGGAGVAATALRATAASALSCRCEDVSTGGPDSAARNGRHDQVHDRVVPGAVLAPGRARRARAQTARSLAAVADSSSPAGRRGVLVGVVEGAAARRLGDRPADERRSLVLDKLTRLFRVGPPTPPRTSSGTGAPSRTPEAPTPRCSHPAHGHSTGRRCGLRSARSIALAPKPPSAGTATSAARSDPARMPPQQGRTGNPAAGVARTPRCRWSAWSGPVQPNSETRSRRNRDSGDPRCRGRTPG